MPNHYLPVFFLLVLTLFPISIFAEEADPLLLGERGLEIRSSDLRQAWLSLSPDEQAQLSDNITVRREFVQRLYRDRRMVAEAEQLGLDRDPVTLAHLQQVRHDVLTLALRDYLQSRIPMPDVTALARERYATRQSELGVSEEYRAAHILLRVRCEAEREAQRARIAEIKAELDKGADFAELARAHSEDTGAASGGELPGWLSSDNLVPSFADALTELSDGAISAPVETEFGYHLIRRLDHRPARIPPFEELQAELEAEIRTRFIRDQLSQALGAYLPGEGATLDEAALEVWRAEP